MRYLLFIITQSLVAQPVIYFIPPLGSFDGGSFYHAFYQVAAQKGFDVVLKTYDDDLSPADYLVACHVPLHNDHEMKIKGKQSLCILTEPPAVFPQNYNRKNHLHFTKIMTYNDAAVDNKKYFKLLHPQTETSIRDTNIPFKQKKLCVMIAANKNSAHQSALYNQRREIVRHFQKLCPNDFDVYGGGWQSPCHKKSTLPKHLILSHYRFSVCYENSKMNGYITEKIFDVMASRCIPIYYGAPNITEYVPSSCFIDRRNFHSNKELYHYIKHMSEKKYNEYLVAIEHFMEKKGYRHNEYTFVAHVLDLLTS